MTGGSDEAGRCAPEIRDAGIHRVPVTIGRERVNLVVSVVLPGPAGDGPYPTLVFHHGSTGFGNQPALFTRKSRCVMPTRWFVDRGWAVVLPNRRGRGGSEGHYDEGFDPTRSHYSGDPA